MKTRRDLLSSGAALFALLAAGRPALAADEAAGDELENLVSRGGKEILLARDGKYSVLHRLRVPAATTVDLGGSTVFVDVDEESNATLVEVNRIRNGTIVLRDGRHVERMLGNVPAAGVPGAWEDLVVRQQTGGKQRWRNQNDNDDALIRIRNDGTVLRNLSIEGVDYCLRIYANNVKAEKISVREGLKGLILDGCSGFQCRGYSSQGKSPNASTDPGHNAIGSGAHGGGPLNDISIENFDIFETGEHGIYFSRSFGSVGRNMRITDGRIRRTGQCALKLRYYSDVTLRNINVEDCSFGNRTGSNEDGLRLERCSNVHVERYSVRSSGQQNSSNFGAVFGGCDSVTLRDLTLERTVEGGLRIGQSTIGDTPNYPSGDIRGENIAIRGSRGAGIVIDHAGAEIGDITLTGLRIDGCGGPPVKIAADRFRKGARIILKGTYANCRGGLPDVSRYPQIDLSGLRQA